MIGIDAGNSLDRLPTGVAVYARNLLAQLARAHADERFAWFYRSNRYLRSFSGKLPPNARRRLLEESVLYLTARGLSLFHGLNQRLPNRLRVPRVATFHDLFALTGEYSTPQFRQRFAHLARETATRADHVIAVSEHTAGLVADRLAFPRESISVVHHGVEALEIPKPETRRAVLRDLGVDRPFVLHVGSLQVRKNIEGIVSAFESMSGSLDLVLAGAAGYGADRIARRIQESPASSRIRMTGHVGDNVRATLYAEAEALVFPSFEEGFGLPVVEAFSVGLPVVASNVSAVAEVAGEAAILVDPFEPEGMATALERVVSDSALRAELRRKGLERAKRFSWERCAAETWDVYRSLQGG